MNITFVPSINLWHLNLRLSLSHWLNPERRRSNNVLHLKVHIFSFKDHVNIKTCSHHPCSGIKEGRAIRDVWRWAEHSDRSKNSLNRDCSCTDCCSDFITVLWRPLERLFWPRLYSFHYMLNPHFPFFLFVHVSIFAVHLAAQRGTNQQPWAWHLCDDE